MGRKIIDTNTFYGIWPRANIDSSLDRLLRIIEEKNIMQVFTLSAKGIFYDYKEGNDETFKACSKYKKLIPVATVCPQEYFGCQEEIVKRWDQGFKVFKFFPEFQDWDTQYLPFQKIFETFSKTNAIIILPAMLGISAIYRMSKDLENPIIISELRFSDMAECLCVLHESKNIYLETQRLSSKNAFEIFSSEGLIDKLVIGTSTPIRYTSASITQIEYANLSEEDKNKIFYKNVEKILKGTTS